MNIVCCTDHNFIMPCGIMMYSLCKNNPSHRIDFFVIIDESVTPSDKELLIQVTESYPLSNCMFCLIDGEKLNDLPRLDESNTKDYITKATYYRLFLQKILPESIDKVLYLDCDIICNGSIRELYSTDFEDNIFATPDIAEGLIDRYNRLRYPQTQGYFNAGVLLINLKYWRENNVLNDFLDFITTHPDWIKLHDQDVLNKTFHDKKKHLPIKFNFQEGYLWREALYDYWKYEKEVIEARNNPVIIHYTNIKPWWNTCVHPMAFVFLDYKNETYWKDTPLTNKRPKEYLLVKVKHRIGNILRRIKLLPPLPIKNSKPIYIQE